MTAPFTLDHLVLVTNDYDAASANALHRFGRPADWTTADTHVRTAEWRTRTGAVEILEPTSPAPPEKLGLVTLVLGTTDLDAAHAQLASAGLEPSEPARAEHTDLGSGEHRAWHRFRVPDAHLGGLKLFVLEREALPRIGGGVLRSVEIRTAAPDALRALLSDALGLEASSADTYALGEVELRITVEPAAHRHGIAGYSLD